MYKFEELLKLEKNCNIELQKCECIYDRQTENKRERILKYNGKNYYHLEIDNVKVECFEILDWWHPFENRICYVYTPDDLHAYGIDLFLKENRICREYYELQDSQIIKGLKAEFNGDIITYVDEEHLDINGKIVKVVNDSTYVHKCQKTQIRAFNGAKGLFEFLEQVAEESKYRYTSFQDSFKYVCDSYR